MKWALGVAAAALLAGGAVLAGIPLILVVMAGGAAHQSTDCLPGMVAGPDGWTGAVPAGATVPGMTPTQIAHAATVVGCRGTNGGGGPGHRGGVGDGVAGVIVPELRQRRAGHRPATRSARRRSLDAAAA